MDFGKQPFVSTAATGKVGSFLSFAASETDVGFGPEAIYRKLEIEVRFRETACETRLSLFGSNPVI